MAMKTGHDLGGIRSIEDIRIRCEIEPYDDACWIWKGALEKGVAKAWYAPIRESVRMSVIMCLIQTGRRPGHTAWYTTCDVRECANPAHWMPGSFKAALKRRPRRNIALTGRKLALIARAKSKLNEAKVEEIRQARGVKTRQQLSDEYGISTGQITRIWSGVNWKPIHLGTSIFNLV